MARRKHYQWQSEAELAAQVVAHLRRTQWTVYQEIAGIDIVAVKNHRRWAIECKRHWNLGILQQAWQARDHAHGSSMAVPAVFPGRDHRFCLAAAKAMGFGVLQVGRPDSGRRSVVRETVKPQWHTSCDTSLDAWLNDTAQDHAAAGSPAAAAWTPFKQTRASLIALAQQQPGINFSHAIASISHHYASNSSARSQLQRLINNGDIPELQLTGRGRDCCLWPCRGQLPAVSS